MTLPSSRSVVKSTRTSESEGRTSVPMKIRSRQPSSRNSRMARPSWPTEIQRWEKFSTRAGSQAPRRGNNTGVMPRAASDSATANGIAPPPATTPTGDEISEAADVMPGAIASSLRDGGKTERALALADEVEDFGDRRIFTGERPRRLQAFGKGRGAMEEFLIERAHGRKPLLGELAPLHADQVEAFEHGILAVDEAERNDVVAHAADAADHNLRTDAGELVHRGQTSDEDEITDLAVTAERGRRREDHVVADVAVMADMAAIHEIVAVADLCDAAACDRAGVHGHGLADGAARTDLELRQFATIAERLRRRAERGEWIDGAIVTDRGLRGNMHMSDQLAVAADHDMRTDDAIGSDLGALADHSAVRDPCGGINLTHQAI